MNNTVVPIIVALITGSFGFLGMLLTNKSNNSKMLNEIKTELAKHEATNDTKIDELTREVREHNNFARRMPVVEEQIKVINHRLNDLESELKK